MDKYVKTLVAIFVTLTALLVFASLLAGIAFFVRTVV